MPSDPSPAGQANWGAYAQFGEALKQAGVLRGGAPLQRAATAATVMARAGKEQSAVGQHGKAREELGGFFIIDVINAEAAMKWARRAPAYDTGAVEVRASYAAPNMK